MKISFDDNTRIQCLLSVLEGEAKQSVEAIGHNGIFYATALKSLKRDFGNPVIVSHLKIQSLLDQPQIKPNDKIGLWHYHQQVKITNTWLLSMGLRHQLFFMKIYQRQLHVYPTILEHSSLKQHVIMI